MLPGKQLIQTPVMSYRWRVTESPVVTQISIVVPPTNMTSYCSTRPGSDRFSSRRVGCALWTPGVGFLWWICRVCLFIQRCGVCSWCRCAACSLQTLCRQQSVIRVKGWAAVEALYSAGKFGRRWGFWRLFRKLFGYLAQSDKRLSVVLHPK